jgi:hypothetical protein
MNSKKAITLLVIATMLLSITPILSVSADVNIVDLTGENGADYLFGQWGVVYGDVMKIYGTGGTPGKNVNVYWDAIDDWNGESGLLNTTKAEGNGDYELWFEIPEAVYGDHFITVENARTGEIYTELAPIVVEAFIEVDPESGLDGDEVTVNGYGFDSEVEIVDFEFDGTDEDLSPGTPETNEVGSWTATFEVPDIGYGVYNVYAQDDTGYWNDTTFEIGPSITLNKEEGPSGTVVRITGRGFTDGYGIGNGTIEYNGVPCGIITDNAKVKSTGTFTCDVVIPETAPVEEEYDLYVQESGAGVGVDAMVHFEILGNAGIEVTPEYGPVGSTVTVKGYNFTQINGEDVLLELNGIGDKTVETDSNGEFTATFRIPGAADTVPLTATQADFGIQATQDFRVGFITVVVFPDSGPAGEELSITGSGFDETDEWNATLGDELIVDAVGVGAGGVISATRHVPSMEPGEYEIVVTEDDTGITVIVPFTVTENTYLVLSPMMAPAGFDVDIEGYNFAQNPAVPDNIEFVLYNDTVEWDLSGLVEYDGNPVELPPGPNADEDWDDGYFEGTFTLPDDEEISIGTYWLNVTDDEGMFAQYMFQIVDKTVDIEPKKTVFRVGETVGFNVESSFAQPNSYIKIWDPSGNLYWQTDAFAPDSWVEVGTIQRVPYYSQVAGGNPMNLLDDAPLGTWEWTWYDVDDEELDEGTFEVAEAEADVIGEQVADLNNQITDLASQLSDVSDEFADVKSDIADVAAIAEQAVTAANQAAEAVQTVAQTANTASQAAADAATAAEAARDAANGLTTLVYGAIGAALVAALAAIVSLMQISRRIAG